MTIIIIVVDGAYGYVCENITVSPNLLLVTFSSSFSVSLIAEADEHKLLHFKCKKHLLWLKKIQPFLYICTFVIIFRNKD